MGHRIWTLTSSHTASFSWYSNWGQRRLGDVPRSEILLNCVEGAHAKATKSEEWITNTAVTTGEHLTVCQFVQAFGCFHLSVSCTEHCPTRSFSGADRKPLQSNMEHRSKTCVQSVLICFPEANSWQQRCLVIRDWESNVSFQHGRLSFVKFRSNIWANFYLEHKAVQHVGGGGFSVVGGGYSQRHIHAAAWLKETEAEPGKGEVAFSSKTNWQSLRQKPNARHIMCGEEQVPRGGGGRDGAQQTRFPWGHTWTLKRPWQAETVLPTSVLLVAAWPDSSDLDIRPPNPFDLTELEKTKRLIY